MTHDDSFATRIIKCRSAKGWSQADLSKASGVAPAQISRYEQGDVEPRPVALAKLSAALNVSFSYLALGYEEKIEEDAADEDRYTRITLRIPKELHEKLAATAAESSKSMNAEIIGILQAAYNKASAIQTVSEDEVETIIRQAIQQIITIYPKQSHKDIDLPLVPARPSAPHARGPTFDADGKVIMGNSDEIEANFASMVAEQEARTNKKTG